MHCNGAHAADDFPTRLNYTTADGGSSRPSGCASTAQGGCWLGRVVFAINAIHSGIQAQSTATNNGASLSIGDTTMMAGPRLAGKSRNSTVAAGTIVQNDDNVGQLVFCGDDGTDLTTAAASIQAFVDGTPGSNDMPGRLVFSTTADGASSPTERLTIDSSGNLAVGSTSPQARLEVRQDSSTAYDSSDDSAQRIGTSSICITNHDGSTDSFSQLVFDTASSNQSIARIVAIRTGTSSNDLTFVVEGSNTKREAMRIDSSGRLLVGVTSALNVGAGSTATRVKLKRI